MIACKVVRQRNFYKTTLDEHYDKKVIGLYLICMHPDNANKSYDRFEVPTRWNSSGVGLQFLVFVSFYLILRSSDEVSSHRYLISSAISPASTAFARNCL